MTKMELCKKSECTGCMACINICPRKAIVLQQDEEGFLYPIILKDNCIKCGACVKVCPQMNSKRSAENYDKKVYAGWMKNRRLRRRSTSGGAFTAFAKEIMSNNGVVYGAGFDKDNKVIHKRITKKSELKQLRGSKYVQSYIGNTFSQVKDDILNGMPVLFSGTPCQIDGLYSYLGNRYEKQLFTIDLVCHGVPSPEIFSKYLEYLEKQYKSKVKKVYFRDKEPGWYVFGMRVEFQNGFVYKKNTYEDPFARGFLRNLFLRPSCHSCHYANNQRIADITLADFWGYQSTNEKDYDDAVGRDHAFLWITDCCGRRRTGCGGIRRFYRYAFSQRPQYGRSGRNGRCEGCREQREHGLQYLLVLQSDIETVLSPWRCMPSCICFLKGAQHRPII